MDQFAPNAGPFGDRPPMDCLKRHHVSLLDPQPIFDDVRTVGGTTGYARGSAGQIGTVPQVLLGVTFRHFDAAIGEKSGHGRIDILIRAGHLKPSLLHGRGG